MSVIHNTYCSSAKVTENPDGQFLEVTVNGTRFAWPANVPVHELLRICGELDVPTHPHQYIWGQTTIKSGDLVIDIGACEGGFSALAEELGARAIAVEPSRLMQRVIRRLFEYRGLPEPRIVAEALSDTQGNCMFFATAKFGAR